ncbi:MAG: HU family DNA-binding protein [Bacillota bacterium]|nr:HU family DNA-binding protein [Bacillota bacterium]
MANRVELVKRVAEKTGLTKKDLELALKGFVDLIEETVANGEKVQIIGFGIFEPRERAARSERKGRNPHTGEEIIIPAQPEKTVPAFKPGKAFKELMISK